MRLEGESSSSAFKTNAPANPLQAINSLIYSLLPPCPLTQIKAGGLPATPPLLISKANTQQCHQLPPCLQTSMGNGFWKPVRNLRIIWKLWVRNFSFYWIPFWSEMSYFCVKAVVQGEVKGWTGSTRNKIIQFHALSIVLCWKCFCPPVTVQFNPEPMQKGFSQAVISPHILESTTRRQILQLFRFKNHA